jgi:Ca2+-transporting ATPase
MPIAIQIRHHLPGRTRLGIAGWPKQALMDQALAALQASGWTIGSMSRRSGGILLHHPKTLSGEGVVEAFLGALAGNTPEATPRPGTAPEHGMHGPIRRDAPRRIETDDVLRSSTREPEAVLVALRVGPEGLAPDEARHRLAVHGPNVIAPPRGRSRREMVVGQVATFPVALLVGSAVLSAATGGLLDAAVTVGVVIVNAAIGFLAEDSTEKLIRRLSKPVEHQALVRRGGAVLALPAREIVPGDLILLRTGSMVPADARVIESRELSVDESVLTGESLPARKRATTFEAPPGVVTDRANILHGGTVVTGGDGLAVVLRTGDLTEIARTRAMIGEARRPRPAMEEKLERLSTRLAVGCVAVSGLVLGIGILRGEPFVQIVRSAVALAVSAIPEGLPAVATTTLALGARAMERERIFARALPAVEAIGGIDTICLDKTGTLTANRMAVVAVAGPDGLIERPSDGNWPAAGLRVSRAMLEALALCNEASLVTGEGSATEKALLTLALENGEDPEAWRVRAPLRKVLTRNHHRRWMATEHGNGEGCLIAAKGAPDDLLAHCAHEGTGEGLRPLDAARRGEILAVNERLAARGLRVLGVARREGQLQGEAPGPLTWLGLVGLADPVRAEARQAIDIFHRAGIRTIMITGDQPATALAVAETLGLSRSGIIRVADGSRIKGMTNGELGRLALETSVFARVSPSDKLRIVKALQGAGRRVAMIGDGVNDGPALRMASVGIAMGRNGTDIAREVADLVIADDDLTRLAAAIARGRSTEDNIRSALRFFLSTNLSEVLLMLGETLHGRGELETPMELFWLNLVTDVFPALGLALAEPAGDVMTRAPRGADAPLLDRAELTSLGFDASGIAGAALVAHFLGMARSGIGPEARSGTFLTLALAQVAHAWALRDHYPRTRDSRQLSERRLEAALGAALGLLVLPFVAPPLRRLLGIGPLGGRIALTAATLAGSAYAIAEGRRLIVSRPPAGQGPRSGLPPGRTA